MWAGTSPRFIVLAAVLSGAGHVGHNLAEFPPAILVAPATIGPLAITGVILWGLLRRPGRPASLLAGGWVALVIVVGGASVFPLGVWPFVPEQSVGHYLAHGWYVVAQLPLLWVAIDQFRRYR